MTTKPLPPDTPSTTVKVEVLPPLLLTEEEAAMYTGTSTSWLRNQRSKDSKLIAQGYMPEGPPWVRMRTWIRYRPEDVVQWIEDNLMEMAKSERPHQPHLKRKSKK
ncbi:MAG: hypothetical protein ABW162_15905 [Candidatus Sedimenticola sp. PURPLELP]